MSRNSHMIIEYFGENVIFLTVISIPSLSLSVSLSLSLFLSLYLSLSLPLLNSQLLSDLKLTPRMPPKAIKVGEC